MAPDPAITVVNHYRLFGGREAFVAAVRALVQRVQSEGHPGVMAYHFFCSDHAAKGHAVVQYRDPKA